MIAIEMEQNRRAFSFGERIAGTVCWSDQLPQPDRFEVRLIWYTQGKGDRDVSIVQQQTIEPRQPSGHAPFAFEAPNGPYSFSGRLISLLWAIEVVAVPSR